MGGGVGGNTLMDDYVSFENVCMRTDLFILFISFVYLFVFYLFVFLIYLFF